MQNKDRDKISFRINSNKDKKHCLQTNGLILLESTDRVRSSLNYKKHDILF